MMRKLLVSVLMMAMGFAANVCAQAPPRADAAVATVLALLPADNGIAQQRLMATLAEAGEPAVKVLVNLLASSDSSTRVQASYALSGLAAYATTQTEANRAKIAAAYAQTIPSAAAVSAKQLLIQQLQWMAGQEAIAALTTCLQDPALVSSAAYTLAKIHTEEALGLLVAAIPSQRDPRAKEQLVLALAQAKASQAEAVILGLLGSGEENLQRVALYALGELGGAASLPALGAAAKTAAYGPDRLGATAAYLKLIARVAALGDVERAGKEARKLIKLARKKQAHQTRVAALQLIMQTDPSHAAAVAAKAQQDTDPRFRAAAKRFATENGYASELAAHMNKNR